jgi:ABC-type antimicrobial peptide transport system permease subunit
LVMGKPRFSVTIAILLVAQLAWASLGAQKKPTWWNTSMVVHHVGLLFNEPPGRAGLSFT